MSCFHFNAVPAKDVPSKQRASDTSIGSSASSNDDNSESILNAAYRKADLRLIACYSIVYFFLKIESHNITNAAIMNIEDGTDIQHELGNLTSEQWALALSVSHYPYLAFEPFSAFLLKRFSPRTWMSRLTLTWGIIAMCHGATQNYGGLLTCRFLLGLAEAGFFPGVIYHLSFWYPTSRLPVRIAFFAASGAVAGAISGLLAFAISFLNGLGGLAGWRYLFIIEGAPTVLCGMYTWKFLPNYPSNATFLTDSQRKAVLEALPKTQPNSQDETCSWKQIVGVFKDSTTFTFLIIGICHAIGSKGVTTVLPTVLFGLGMTGTATTQLLTMPPYLAGACSVLFIAWLVRAQKLNCWVAAIFLEVIGCVCYIVLITVDHSLLKYVFVIVATMSSVGVVPILWPERIRAAHGTTSAALAIGLTAAAPILSGIVGPQIYQKNFGPSYRVSYAVSVALLSCVVASTLVTWIIIRRRDKRTEMEQDEDDGKGKAERHGSDTSSSVLGTCVICQRLHIRDGSSHET